MNASHLQAGVRIKLGVVMDPISSIHYKKDTTLALLWAAQDAGCELFYLEQKDLFIERGSASAAMCPLDVMRSAESWYRLGSKKTAPLSSLDIVLMRKDPPFDIDYVYSTYILDLAEKQGVFVVNRPQSLRECNEKIFATHFPQCCPPVLVSSSLSALQQFAGEQGDIVIKPLDGMGGQGIFRVMHGDPNLNVIIETVTRGQSRLAMAQRYLPDITAGDKRILMVAGEPVPYCLARIPKSGEFRGNLAAGGRGEVRLLTDRDRWIAGQVAPALKQKGLWFVGLDVIGDYLTEINVTSPTCLREIEAATGLDIAANVMSAILQELASRKPAV